MHTDNFHESSHINFLHYFEQMCVRELRERVASGGDPTKLRESLTEHVSANVEHGMLAVLLLQTHSGLTYVCIFIGFFSLNQNILCIPLKGHDLFYGYYGLLEMDNSIGECATIHPIKKCKWKEKIKFLVGF